MKLPNPEKAIVDFIIVRKEKQAMVRSVWLVRDDEDFPRLVTCFVRKDGSVSLQMKLLDVVALLEDLPELGIYRGQVGTIVEVYEPGVFEVEFSDLNGRAYAIETLTANQIMVLHHHKLIEETLVKT